MKARLLRILAFGDTRPTRLWLALMDFTFAVYLSTDMARDADAVVMNNSIPFYDDSYLVWMVCFTIHGIALLRGLSGRFNFCTLMLEGVFGIALWGITAITHTMAQGAPGPAVIAALMCVWLFARYPTHWGSRGD